MKADRRKFRNLKMKAVIQIVKKDSDTVKG